MKRLTDEHRMNEYLDFVNNYLTVERFAEHRGLTIDQATFLINSGRDLHEARVEEYKRKQSEIRKLDHYKHVNSKVLAKEVLGKLALQLGRAIFIKGEESTCFKRQLLKQRCK